MNKKDYCRDNAITESFLKTNKYKTPLTSITLQITKAI